MESPILYIVFNRPEVTEITFQKIKEMCRIMNSYPAAFDNKAKAQYN